MRGSDEQQEWMFSYISAEKRVPKDHPLRTIRTMVDVVLKELSPLFESLYAKTGRPSIAPEKLLRTLLLQVVLAENPASLSEEFDGRRRQRILNDYLQHSDRGLLSVMERPATPRDRRPSFRDDGTSLRHSPLLQTISCGRGCSK